MIVSNKFKIISFLIFNLFGKVKFQIQIKGMVLY